MASTYTPIASTTLSSAQSSVTFSSIPSTYTDLVIILNLKADTLTNYPIIEFNGDTTKIYSQTFLTGNGSSAASTRYSNEVGYLEDKAVATSTDFSFMNVVHVMNYSNSTTYKTVLARAGAAGSSTDAGVLMWRSTAAITSIKIRTNANNWVSGSTFSLYGIKSA